MLVYPNLNPVAFTFGSIKIYWYGILYLVSFAVIWWLALQRQYQHSHWTRAQIGDLIFYAALGVIIGGRVGEMLFYEWPEFSAHPLSLFEIWHGGMSFHGGLIGVLLAIYFYIRRVKWSFWEVMDFIAPLVPVGLFLGRIGNFINHELVGRVTNVKWAMVYPMFDLQPRHPSQLYEALAEGVILFVILWLYSLRPRSRGAVAMMFLLGYGGLRFICEFFREPENPLFWHFLTRGQLLSLPMIIIGGVALFFIYRRKK